MTKCLLFILLLIVSNLSQGQSIQNLVLMGNYSVSDSTHVSEAYLVAREAVRRMHKNMDAIWKVDKVKGKPSRSIRRERWRKDSTFIKWLGCAEKIRMVHRKIRRIDAKFDKKMVLEVRKENRGRCIGWISAWTIPFGKVKIRLCEDYFVYRTRLQEKVIIHELGHEAGMFSHRHVHGCRAAKRAASSKRNVAKKSPENYAWLAMSYLGLECSY